MNKLIRNFTFAIALIFTFMLFQPATVNAEEPSSSDTVTITYDLNGGTCYRDCVLSEEVEVGTSYLLPGPEVPEHPIEERPGDTVYAPERKWFAAFEINGKEYELGAEIEVTEDITIKYLYKDMIYIHRVDITLDAPVVGSEVTVEEVDFDEDDKIKIQVFGPSIDIPENDLYYILPEMTYWYVEDGENIERFEGKIEKNTSYKAVICVVSTDRGIDFADDLKVFVNGKEYTDFENYKVWTFVYYKIESVEDNEEYTLESPTDKIDAIISFIEQKGEIYSFDIKEYLAITDEDIQKEVDFWNQYLEDDEKLTFEEIKAEFNKIINYGKNAANGKGDLLKLYELYLYNNGEEIHKVEGGFKIKLKITDDIKGYDSYKLIYIAEDGTTEDAIELKINGKYLEGTLSHLSMYALVGSNAETTNNPQTGDNVMFYISMLGLSIIGLAGAGIYTKKKIIK